MAFCTYPIPMRMYLEAMMSKLFMSIPVGFKAQVIQSKPIVVFASPLSRVGCCSSSSSGMFCSHLSIHNLCNLNCWKY